MAGEFKIKTGLALGASPHPVNTITNDHLYFSNDDTSALATVSSIKQYVDACIGNISTDVSLNGISDVTITDASTHDILTPNLSGQWINQQKEWYLDGSLIKPVDSTVDVELSAIEIDEDSGAVTLVDMSVTSTPSAGTEESYGFNIDGTEIATIYSESDGAGGIQNSKLLVKEDFETEKEVFFTGIDESSQTKSLYYNPTSGEVTFDDVSTGGAGGTAAWGGITGNLEDQTDVSTAIDEKLDKTGGTISGDLEVTGNLELSSSSYQYMGDPNTNGSWRFYITNDSSTDMVFEKRVSGSWVEKGRFN